MPNNESEDIIAVKPEYTPSETPSLTAFQLSAVVMTIAILVLVLL